jgi:hypothetical protein
MSKNKTLAIVAAVAAFGAVSASAATLGGLNGASLGADTKVVAACDTVGGVTVGYTPVYNVATKAYNVSAVNLSLIDAACTGKTITLTLADGAGASIATGTLAAIVAGGTATVPLAAPVAAGTVANVAVVISG